MERQEMSGFVIRYFLDPWRHVHSIDVPESGGSADVVHVQAVGVQGDAAGGVDALDVDADRAAEGEFAGVVSIDFRL